MASKQDDNYDPHEFRQVEHPTTNWQTMTHFLKASIGTGVLAMPSAFANAGYVTSPILAVIIGIIAVYCLHILIRAMYTLCKRQHVPYLTYSEAMTIGMEDGPKCFQCFKKCAGPFVDGFLAFYHFGICCVYVVFIAGSIKQIVDEYVYILDIRLHMVFLLIPLLLIYSIRNLKYLAPFSAAANFMLLFGFSVLLYYILSGLPPLDTRDKMVDIKKWPIFFGTVLFALEAVGVILAMEEHMATPKDFVKPLGIMNIGMTIVLILYIALGFFGYWKYGKDALGSVTLNIPQDDILAQVIKVVFAITIWISYALQGFVTVDIIWNKYWGKKIEDPNKRTTYELMFRSVVVVISILCAISVPDLGLFLSLVGAFCLSILGLIFPAVLDICVLHRDGYGPCFILLFRDIFLICFGAFGGIVGTSVSIIEIVRAYYDKNFMQFQIGPKPN